MSASFLPPSQSFQVTPTGPDYKILYEINNNPCYIPSYSSIRNGMILNNPALATGGASGATGNIYLPSASQLCQEFDLTGFNANCSFVFPIYNLLTTAPTFQIQFTGQQTGTIVPLALNIANFIVVFVNPTGPTSGPTGTIYNIQ
jgi:hypothetical protein